MVADLDGTQKGKGNNDERDKPELPPLYSIYVSAWGSYTEGRNVLLSAYLLAHSFLIAATVFLFISLEDTLCVGKIALLLLSFVGLILAIQVALTWNRSVNRVYVFESHLRRLEKAFLQIEKEGPTLFTDWHDLEKGRKEKLDNPDDLVDPPYANWATKFQSKECWTSKASKAKGMPFLLMLVYIFFFVVAVVELID